MRSSRAAFAIVAVALALCGCGAYHYGNTEGYQSAVFKTQSSAHRTGSGRRARASRHRRASASEHRTAATAHLGTNTGHRVAVSVHHSTAAGHHSTASAAGAGTSEQPTVSSDATASGGAATASSEASATVSQVGAATASQGDAGAASTSRQRWLTAYARRHSELMNRDAALLREDPALRFVLLDIPHDPALRISSALAGVARRVVQTEIDGQETVFILPRHSNGRAILFAHGSDETPNYDIDVSRSGRTIDALVAAGYTWAESTANFNNWGDQASVRDDVAVAEFLRHHGYRTIDLGGDSMGGLDATELIPLVHPEAVFELFPVCDEQTMVHLFKIDITHADARVSQLSPVAMRDVNGLPMLFTASPEDTLVPKATNADVCVREARAAGALVREVTTTGEHDDPSNWQPQRLISFLDDAAELAEIHSAAGAGQTDPTSENTVNTTDSSTSLGARLPDTQPHPSVGVVGR